MMRDDDKGDAEIRNILNIYHLYLCTSDHVSDLFIQSVLSCILIHVQIKADTMSKFCAKRI